MQILNVKKKNHRNNKIYLTKCEVNLTKWWLILFANFEKEKLLIEY